MVTQETYGRYLKGLIGEAGYKTDTAFAEAIGQPSQRVSDWVNDKDRPHQTSHQIIIKVLNLPLYKLTKFNNLYAQPPRRVREKPVPFITWLLDKKNTGNRQFPAPRHLNKLLSCGDMDESIHCQLACTVIIDAPGTVQSSKKLLARGYRNIKPEVSTKEYNVDAMKEHVRGNDTFKREFARDLEGRKGTPTAIHLPLSESGTLIEMEQIDYNTVRAFHMALYEDAALQQRLAPHAFDILNAPLSRDAFRLPGILTLDVVVITSDNYIVLGHRKYRSDGYYANTWSASFEEQFSAIPNKFENETKPRDNSVKDAVIRGLKEELVSPVLQLQKNAITLTDVALHALYLDLVLLNWQFLATVKLTDITFSELHAHWLKPDELEDKNEHDYLFAIKADPAILEHAVYGNDLSQVYELHRLGSDALILKCAPEAEETLVKHGWQPRSQTRLACCWWMAEQGLI